MNRRKNRIPYFVGFGLIALASVLLWSLVTAPKVKVLVPKADISAFQPLSAADFEEIEVVKDDEALRERELTTEWLDKNVKDGQEFFSYVPRRATERIDVRSIGTNLESSYAIVSPDEEIVAVETTAAGAVGGIIRPGSVVNVSTESGDTEFAKVLAYGAGLDAGEGIVSKKDADEEEDEAEAGNDIVIILAVAADDASSLGTEGARLSLIPNCVVGSDKKFMALDPDLRGQGLCEVSGRDASEGAGVDSEGEELLEGEGGEQEGAAGEGPAKGNAPAEEEGAAEAL